MSANWSNNNNNNDEENYNIFNNAFTTPAIVTSEHVTNFNEVIGEVQ